MIKIWFLLLFFPILGDLIHLKDGRTLEGKLQWQGKKYLLKMRYGSIYLKPSEIKSIEKKKTPREKIEKAIKNLKAGDIEGRFRLAGECYRQHWNKKARSFLLELIQEKKSQKRAMRLYKKWFVPSKKKIPPLLQMEIPFGFQRSTWREVLGYLKTTTGFDQKIPLRVRRVLDKRKIRLTYKHPGRKLQTALNEICFALGIGWQFKKKTLFFNLKLPKIKKKKFIHLFRRKRLTLQVKTTLGKFLGLLKKITGVPIVLDGNISPSLPVQVESNQMKAPKVLKKVLGPHHLDFIYLDDIIYISTVQNCAKMK